MNRKTFLKTSIGLFFTSQLSPETSSKTNYDPEELTIPLDLYCGGEDPIGDFGEVNITDAAKIILHYADEELANLLIKCMKKALRDKLITAKDYEIVWLKDPYNYE